jgi:CRP-like cAMP-binding protein
MEQHREMNKLLASLPPEETAKIAPDLEPVSLRRGQCLYRYGDQVSHVYFPVNAVASLFCPAPDGKSCEIGMAGPESAVGLTTALGPDLAVHTAETLVSGRAMRIRADTLKWHCYAPGPLRLQVTHQLWALLAQADRLASCNLHHQIPERLCRWLLTLRDRVGGDEFHVTHAQIAERLGIRRSGVTIQLGLLEELGAIEYRRRWIRIVRRASLERISCECYERSVQENGWAGVLQPGQGARPVMPPPPYPTAPPYPPRREWKPS